MSVLVPLYQRHQLSVCTACWNDAVFAFDGVSVVVCPAHAEDICSDAEVITQQRIKMIFLLRSSVRTMSSKGIVRIVAGSPVKELCVLPTS